MRAIGCLLMLSGWLIVMAAVVLLPRIAERFGFVTAGLAVEVLGLVLLAQQYRSLQLAERPRR